MKIHNLNFFNSRPENSQIDTIIIHSCYAPESKDPFLLEESIKLFCQYEVAPHYIIERNGSITQTVSEDARAYHAGESKLPFPDDNREIVNDFSIGIELIGNDLLPFEEAQYNALIDLIKNILSRRPIKNILGHEHIAPERKKDPGVQFQWDKIKSALSSTPNLRFPI